MLPYSHLSGQTYTWHNHIAWRSLQQKMKKKKKKKKNKKSNWVAGAVSYGCSTDRVNYDTCSESLQCPQIPFLAPFLGHFIREHLFFRKSGRFPVEKQQNSVWTSGPWGFTRTLLFAMFPVRSPLIIPTSDCGPFSFFWPAVFHSRPGHLTRKSRPWRPSFVKLLFDFGGCGRTGRA